jgi:nicotinamide mononucleotide transporter
MSTLEIVAVIINILGVWLTAQRIRWCWPVGVLAVLLYAWIFYEARLYSDMLLQVVFAFLQGYGWWCWSKGGLDQGKVHVTRLSVRDAVLSLLVGALCAVLLGSLMATFTDAVVPWLDASLTAFSLVASVWAARKYVASWWLWIVLDCVYVAMYLHNELPLTAGLYVGFVVLAFYGYRAWRRDLLSQEAQGAAVLPG